MPVLEPSKAAVHGRPRPRHPFPRRLFVSTVRFMVVLGISALLGGGWYLAKKGFGRQWSAVVVEELHKRGVEASVGRLTLDPFRGLVAQDVRIFDYKHRETTLAEISRVSLDINYAALLHHKPFLNALDVRDGRLTLPIANATDHPDKAQLTNFHAHIYFPPEQIYVSQAEGVFCGIRISITGQLIKRDDYKPSTPLSEEEWKKRLQLLEHLVTELQKFSYPTEPSLQVKFSGDLADMENARIETSIRADRVKRDNYEVRDLSAAAEFVNQRLTLSQLEWKDAAGVLSARGSWNRPTGEANFQARSDLDLKSLVTAFGYGKFLTDANFLTPPVIEVSGTGNLGAEGRPQIRIIGQISDSKLAYRDVPFSDLRANFSWDGEKTLIRDIHLQNQGGGQLNAEIYDAPDDFRLDLDSTIHPVALRPFLSPELQKFLGEWEWSKSPNVHFSIRGTDHQPQTWKGEGTLALERTKFRGSWMNSATAKVSFGDGAVTYDNLKVTRDEGVATGGFTYDFKRHEVRIPGIKSSLMPAEIIPWIDPDLYKVIVPYKFHKAPAVTASGIYQFAGGKGTRLEITVDAPNGMDYLFLGKILPFDRVAGKLTFTNDRLQIGDLKAALFSGVVKGDTDISLAKNDSHYHATIQAKKLDFPRLTDLYFQYKTAEGQLTGNYDFTGIGSDSRKMKGKGDIEVTDGNVFAIPVFGPLSELLNGVLPGSGYSVARKAHATFAIADGNIHTDDFETSGSLFSLLGNGDLHFADDKLDFNIRMSMKGPGVLLAPVYKLFEYKGEGSLKKPDWHPKRF